MSESIPGTIEAAAAALRAGHISSRELVGAAQERADRLDARLHIYTARFDAQARAAAERADRELAEGADRGPLHGIPLGIKDIIFTEEGPTSGNSLVRDAAWTVCRDAAVVARLRAAGAVITGKLTTMEFATGAPDADGPFPFPRTPWDPDHWAGGSSSGSGNGVAAGAFLGALGSDTGGSVRMPSAYCGVTGLKPTFGRVPLDGVIPFGTSFDCVGPLTRSARDAKIMFEAMAATRLADPGAAAGDLAGLRVGVEPMRGEAAAHLDPAVGAAFEAALAELEAAGATLVGVELPYYQEATDLNLIGMMIEGLAYQTRNLREQWDSFQQLTRLGYASGSFFGAADYLRIQRVRRLVRERAEELLREVDVVAMPTCGTPSPRVGESMKVAKVMASVYTPYWSTTGGPAVSVPMGFEDGLPLGLQLGGRPFEEATVLRVAAAYQERTDWHSRRPPIEAEVEDRVG